MIEKVLISEFVRRCGVIPKQNLWAGVFMCEQPTLKLVTGTDKRGFTYNNNAVCDDCIKEYFDENRV